MTKAAFEIMIPKGTHFSKNSYVFIAPPRPNRTLAKNTNINSYSRERISIRWMDRYQQYRVSHRETFTVLYNFLESNPDPTLDTLITHLTEHKYIQLH